MKKRLLIFTVILTLLCGTLVAYQALGDSRRGGTVTISHHAAVTNTPMPRESSAGISPTMSGPST